MNLITPAFYALIGKQGSGKSYAIKYIMSQLQHQFSYGIIYTNTWFDGNPFPYVSPKFIHPKFTEESLNVLMDMQAKCIKQGIIKEAFVIFDDALNPEQFNSESLEELCTQCRHYHITIIMSTQYCNKINALMRANVMTVLMFKSDNKRNLEACYDSFFQGFDHYSDFKKYAFKAFKSGKYKFIYYDATKNYDDDDTPLKDIYQVLQCPAKIPNFYIEFPKNIELPMKKKTKK